MKKSFLILYSLFIFLFITLKIHNFNVYEERVFNLSFFNTLKKYELNFPAHWSIINIVANVLPFIFLGIIIKWISTWNFFTVFTVTSTVLILLELIQIVLSFGAFDVDDIWLNIISFVYGYIVFSGGTNEKKKKN